MDNAREIMIAVPPYHGDIYRLHQLAWRAMHPYARKGDEFIFASRSPSTIIVRSIKLSRGKETRATEGPMQVCLVATTRSGQILRPLDVQSAPDWLSHLLIEVGIKATNIQVVESSRARGKKRDPITGCVLDIELPVMQIRFDATLQDQGKAQLAWQRGIGRGKRFGFGMLRHA